MLTGLIAGFFLFSCSPEQGLKYNIVFILADDFGYYDTGYSGSEFYETPNIDRIASDGNIFTNGYACCQVCSPSRASILTGQFPARHGITDYIGAKSNENWREKNRFSKLLPASYIHQLDSTLVTLPEALKEEGYTTFFAGKWHLGPRGSWPEDHGFDINIGGWDAGMPYSGYFVPYDNPNLKDGPAGENLSMRLAHETVKFIRDNQPDHTGKPFFAFLSFYAVHQPVEASYDKWKKYRNKAEALGISETGFKMGKYLPIRQVQDQPVYAGLVEQMDDAIGTVLDALTDLNLEKNTIIVFTSDNGGVAAGDDFATSNKPLRAGKGYQFEGGLRVPCVIRVPGISGGGKEIADPVCGTDFYPTFLELAGLDLRPEAHVDGVSLVPLLKGGSIGQRSLIWHYPHYGNQGGEPSSVIRCGDYKLIHYYEDGREELYNLKEDVSETHNLVSDDSLIVRELRYELFDFLKELNVLYPRKDPQFSEEKEKSHLEHVRNITMPRLERERLEYLSREFDPENSWWGSQVTKD